MKRGRLAASFGPGAPRSRSSSRVLECNGSQRLPPQESEPVWVVPLYGRILLLSSTHTRSAPGSVANYQMGKFYGIFWRLTPVGVKFPKFGHVWSSKMSNLVQNFIWSWTKSVILAKIAPSSRYLVNNSTLAKVMGQFWIIQLFIFGHINCQIDPTLLKFGHTDSSSFVHRTGRRRRNTRTRNS